MGQAMLCVGKVADTPYYLDKMDVHIYSLEELCFCIGEKTFLVDEDIVCRELVDWLGNECGLEKLAISLYGYVSKRVSASAFAAAILEYAGYYPPEEVRKLENFLKKNADLDESERRKVMADYLVEAGRFEAAINQYRKFLEEDGNAAKKPEGKEAETAARLWHNMGTAYAGQFLFAEAAECFEQAFALAGFEKSRLHYLAAKRLLLKEKDYIAFVAAHAEEYYEDSMALERLMEQMAGGFAESEQGKEWAQIARVRDENIGEYCKLLEEKTERFQERYREMVKES